MGYPILVNVEGRRVVVVGGGKVGARKVSDLLIEGAAITVISPQVGAVIEAIGERIEVQRMEYAAGMLAEIRPMLVFACTNSPEVNAQVAEEARALGILCNRTDDGKAGDFSNMAKIERGEITIGLATGGAAPALAAFIREMLAASIGNEYAALARIFADLRPKIQEQIDPGTRAGLWQAILRSAVLNHLRDGDEAGARAIIDRLIAEANNESGE